MASSFEVLTTRIARIWGHPNADRLELVAVDGLAFQICIQKGKYSVGDEVVYFPVDSLLPEWIILALNLWMTDETGNVIRDAKGRVRTMLSGADQNKVKTVALRGEISQGMVCPVGVVRPTEPEQNMLFTKAIEDRALATFLGVTKYDAPEIFTSDGASLIPLPDGLGVYDIEGADSHLFVLEALMDIPVCITEKVEGTNHAIVWDSLDRMTVCQRNNAILEKDGSNNTYCAAARAAQFQPPDGCTFPFAFRSEMIGPGIQKNIYGLKKTTILCFDVKVGPNYMNVDDWIRTVPENQRVPILAIGVTLREWLNGRTIQEASNGKSVLSPACMREGIVVRPMVERTFNFGRDGKIDIRRLFLKQRSPIYLANEKD